MSKMVALAQTNTACHGLEGAHVGAPLRSPVGIFVVVFPAGGVIVDVSTGGVQFTFVTDDVFVIIPLPEFLSLIHI